MSPVEKQLQGFSKLNNTIEHCDDNLLTHTQHTHQVVEVRKHQRKVDVERVKERERESDANRRPLRGDSARRLALSPPFPISTQRGGLPPPPPPMDTHTHTNSSSRCRGSSAYSDSKQPAEYTNRANSLAARNDRPTDRPAPHLLLLLLVLHLFATL